MKRVDSRHLEVEPVSLPATAWLDYRAYYVERYIGSWTTRMSMPHCRLNKTLLSTGWFGILWLAMLPASLRAADLAEERAALEAKYAGDLAALAGWCNQRQLKAEAELARRWAVNRDPDKHYVFDLPDAVEPPADLALKPALAEWWRRWTHLRTAQADSLFEIAGKAIAEHRPALAFELIRQAVRENPDHAKARAILGYQSVGGRWLSSYAAGRFAQGRIFDERFGWIQSADVPRYEKGERKSGGKWITAAEDVRQHATIQTGWRIETEHFVVTSDNSLESGVALAQKLERLNEIWRQVFATFYMTEGELKNRYGGASLPQHDVSRHEIVLFRNRDEYNAALKPSQPLIGMTVAYYWFDKRTVYFFAGDEANDETLYHEATHQLFQEVRHTARDLGRENNFWVVEAIACYMESLKRHDGYFTLGGSDEGRMPAAVQRVIDDGFYVPIAEMVAFGRNDLQHDPRLPKLYSESAGLANFFMHYRGGQYRQPFIDYLLAVYLGRANSKTLASLSGASYEQLDREYREYMKRLAQN
jgi:hypothetical protein